MTEKPDSERAVRLRNFRPVRIKLPARLIKEAGAEYDKARAEWDKAWAEWDKARAELDKAWAEYDKTRAEYDKAWDEWDKAKVEYYKVEAELYKALTEYAKGTKAIKDHDSDWPDNTWNGSNIF